MVKHPVSALMRVLPQSYSLGTLQFHQDMPQSFFLKRMTTAVNLLSSEQDRSPMQERLGIRPT
jgi:hypothetical protein